MKNREWVKSNSIKCRFVTKPQNKSPKSGPPKLLLVSGPMCTNCWAVNKLVTIDKAPEDMTNSQHNTTSVEWGVWIMFSGRSNEVALSSCQWTRHNKWSSAAEDEGEATHNDSVSHTFIVLVQLNRFPRISARVIIIGVTGGKIYWSSHFTAHESTPLPSNYQLMGCVDRTSSLYLSVCVSLCYRVSWSIKYLISS